MGLEIWPFCSLPQAQSNLKPTFHSQKGVLGRAQEALKLSIHLSIDLPNTLVWNICIVPKKEHKMLDSK